MRVGVWLYESELIGYVELLPSRFSHSLLDQRLYTQLYNPSPLYHPSRSYWDDNDWIPSNLPPEIDSQHARDMGVACPSQGVCRVDSSRVLSYQHYGNDNDNNWNNRETGITHYEMDDGSDVYTTKYGQLGTFDVGYREWNECDFAHMDKVRIPYRCNDEWIDKMLRILLLVVSWSALIISVALILAIAYYGMSCICSYTWNILTTKFL